MKLRMVGKYGRTIHRLTCKNSPRWFSQSEVEIFLKSEIKFRTKLRMVMEYEPGVYRGPVIVSKAITL